MGICEVISKSDILYEGFLIKTNLHTNINKMLQTGNVITSM